MATQAAATHDVHLDILTNYLISLARTVELAVDRAMVGLLQPARSERQAPSEIFLLEPRINEMGDCHRRPRRAHAADRKPLPRGDSHGCGYN